MSSEKEKKRIKIIVGACVAVVLLVAGLSIPVVKGYWCDSVVSEERRVYIYPNSSEAQIDSLLHDVISDEKAVSRVKRLLSAYEFDASKRVGAYRLRAGMTVREVALKLARGSQTPVRVTFNNVRTLDQLAERISQQLCFSAAALTSLLYNDSVCAGLGFTRATLPALSAERSYPAMTAPAATDTISIVTAITAKGMLPRVSFILMPGGSRRGRIKGERQCKGSCT